MEGGIANVDALFMRKDEAGGLLRKKVKGGAREGQLTFARLTPSGEIHQSERTGVPSVVTASTSRAAATQLFNQYMKNEGREMARRLWKPLLVSTPAHDAKLAKIVRTMASNVDLTCRNTLQRVREAADALTGGARTHQHEGTLNLVVREWVKQQAETLAGRGADLMQAPETIRSRELQAALRMFQDAYVHRFQFPLGDAVEDARFLYGPHVVVTVQQQQQQQGGAAEPPPPDTFMCCIERNIRPSTMEMVRCIVNRTRLSKVTSPLGEAISRWSHDPQQCQIATEEEKKSAQKVLGEVRASMADRRRQRRHQAAAAAASRELLVASPDAAASGGAAAAVADVAGSQSTPPAPPPPG